MRRCFDDDWSAAPWIEEWDVDGCGSVSLRLPSSVLHLSFEVSMVAVPVRGVDYDQADPWVLAYTRAHYSLCGCSGQDAEIEIFSASDGAAARSALRLDISIRCCGDSDEHYDAAYIGDVAQDSADQAGVDEAHEDGHCPTEDASEVSDEWERRNESVKEATRALEAGDMAALEVSLRLHVPSLHMQSLSTHTLL